MYDRLTKKQYEIYKAVYDYIKKYDYSPTIRELCLITGRRAPATIHSALSILKRKGYITFEERKFRTIKILKEIDENEVLF